MTWKRRVRYAWRTSRRRRRRSWRWRASWPRKAPSLWVARERRLSDSTRTHASVAERWSLPQVDGPIVGMRRESPLRERAREAEVRASDEARKAEQDRGYEAGLKAGQAHLKNQTDALDRRVARLDEILNALCRPLPQLETEVEQQLV